MEYIAARALRCQVSRCRNFVTTLGASNMNQHIKPVDQLKRILIGAGLFATFLVGFPSASKATVLTAGQTALFNFDFTSALPGSDFPFYRVVVDQSASSVDTGDWFGTNIYADLNGTNLSITETLANHVGPTLPMSLDFSGLPALDDGIFSVEQFVTTGSVDFSTPTATGYYYVTDNITGGQVTNTYTLTGMPTVRPVPEPYSIGFLILGLTGLIFMRHHGTLQVPRSMRLPELQAR